MRRHPLPVAAASALVLATLAPAAAAAPPRPTSWSSRPGEVAVASDGAVWFTEPPGRLARIAPDGTVAHLPVRRPLSAELRALAPGPGTDVWFTVHDPYGDGSWIGRMTSRGRVTYAYATRRSIPDIAPGARGSVWFTEMPRAGGRAGRIGRVSARGVVSRFSWGLHPSDALSLIVPGAGGTHWFVAGNRIGRVSRTGAIRIVGPRLPVVSSIAAGPDGNVWFTDAGNGRLGRMTPAGRVRTFSPGLRPTGDLAPGAIVADGPGGLRFAARRWSSHGTLAGFGRITTRGAMVLPGAGRRPLLPPGVDAGSVARARDGSLWFTETLVPADAFADRASANRVARITPGGRLVEYPPTLRLVGVGRRAGAVVVAVRCPPRQPAACEAVLRLEGNGRVVRRFVRVSSGARARVVLRPAGAARRAPVLLVALRTAASRDAVRRPVPWRSRGRVVRVPIAPGRWRALPALAPAPHTESVWTIVPAGRRIVLLGWRSCGEDCPAVGGYWPTASVLDTRTWRLVRAPLPPGRRFNAQAGMDAVWTGREVIVAGGANLAFDPVRLRWRAIDTGVPIAGAFVWTGREAIAWGGGCCGEALNTGAAYDPVADVARPLPPAPLGPKTWVTDAWTGRELLVLGGPDAEGAGFLEAGAYDPAGNSWRRIASMPVADESPARWDGREAVLGSLALAYDPATERWRRLDSAVHPRGRMTWAGGRVVFGGWSGAAVPRFLVADPASGTVRRLPAPPVAGHDIAVWTGRGLLVWGTDRRLGGRVENGALFTPRASWGPAS